jgi:chemotaxis protein histidine kinase CheA
MSPLLRSSTSILGAAILGDGRVALILDVPDLIRRAIAATRHLESSRPS